MQLILLILLSWGLLGESAPMETEQFEFMEDNAIARRHVDPSNDYRISENARKHINVLREKAGLPPIPLPAAPESSTKGRTFLASLISAPIYLASGIVNGVVSATTAIVGGVAGNLVSTVAEVAGNTLGSAAGIVSNTLGSATDLTAGLASNIGQNLGTLGAGIGDAAGGIVGSVTDTLIGQKEKRHV